MSKADYPYPDDEFDVVTDPDVPRGVHRAPRSAWSRWWPFLAVVVLAPVLAFGAVTVWGLINDNSIQSEAPGPDTGGDEPAAGDETTDGATEAPTDGATEPPAQTEAAPVLTTPVVVLNGAGVKGLAAQEAQKLTSAGFTTVSTGNTTGAKPAQNTVFYKSDDLRTTAALAAQTLGVATVTLSPTDAGEGITVTLVEAPAA